MTIYSDWLRDFPNRCIDTLTHLEPKARAHSREVTLLICVGSTLLNVPMERLKKRLDKSKQLIEHPMIVHPNKAAQKANRVLAKRFTVMLDDEMFATSSTLWGGNNPEAGSWWGGNLGKEYDPARPSMWFGSGEGWPIPKQWSVRKVVNVIRNACAHAHVLTDSSGGNDAAIEDGQQISRLLFVSVRSPLDEQPTKFRFVATTPDGFRELLKQWAAVISRLDPLGACERGKIEPHLVEN